MILQVDLFRIIFDGAGQVQGRNIWSRKLPKPIPSLYQMRPISTEISLDQKKQTGFRFLIF